ncbi:uncharacterized protein C11orf24 homolog [Suncus etruscus]|uniref:uncharacterized protein C11orf24 homolog n=1 Tax=Suncus etruscus TaxID=109475 RepID=UPI0021104853|nr:uncharacterized protein C11orf24 homolog [Suncus etruscus]XP_049637181.1 uncharacterized protein C11orf24 homolog [Suncus etruscus]
MWTTLVLVWVLLWTLAESQEIPTVPLIKNVTLDTGLIFPNFTSPPDVPPDSPWTTNATSPAQMPKVGMESSVPATSGTLAPTPEPHRTETSPWTAAGSGPYPRTHQGPPTSALRNLSSTAAAGPTMNSRPSALRTALTTQTPSVPEPAGSRTNDSAPLGTPAPPTHTPSSPLTPAGFPTFSTSTPRTTAMPSSTALEPTSPAVAPGTTLKTPTMGTTPGTSTMGTSPGTPTVGTTPGTPTHSPATSRAPSPSTSQSPVPPSQGPTEMVTSRTPKPHGPEAPASPTPGNSGVLLSTLYLLTPEPRAPTPVSKNSLLAALVLGVALLLTAATLLGLQMRESYRKKDYTQVDYLINGMYADTPL